MPLRRRCIPGFALSKRYRAGHSRVVDRRFILGDDEREHFVVLMRQLEAFPDLRVRYLIDGGVFGSAAFVEDVFTRRRELFGLKRKTGARRMREADWEDLCVLRDLKTDLIGEPAERPERQE